MRCLGCLESVTINEYVVDFCKGNYCPMSGLHISKENTIRKYGYVFALHFSNGSPYHNSIKFLAGFDKIHQRTYSSSYPYYRLICRKNK
jgi:formylmethanofuran dehydrogenase subunit B